MGLQDRIKKVQEFEKSLDPKLRIEEQTREKQLDKIKREINTTRTTTVISGSLRRPHRLIAIIRNCEAKL
jgi:hypothetical protein